MVTVDASNSSHPGPASNLSESSAARGRARAWVLCLLMAWAAFWIWFSIASAIGEGSDGLPHLAMAAGLLAIVALGWARPRIGALVLLVAGLAAAWFFRNTFARLSLSLPAVLLAALVFWTSPAPRLRR